MFEAAEDVLGVPPTGAAFPDAMLAPAVLGAAFAAEFFGAATESLAFPAFPVAEETCARLSAVPVVAIFEVAGARPEAVPEPEAFPRTTEEEEGLGGFKAVLAVGVFWAAGKGLVDLAGVFVVEGF